MKNYEDMVHHPVAAQLVETMCRVTRTDNPLFFNVLVAYYFSVVAATMRAKIRTVEGDVLPINTYAIGLMPSGMGKGRSVGIMEKDVLAQFMDKFKFQTLPMLESTNIPALAQERQLRKGTDPDKELEKTQNEYESTGELYFFINKGTEAALKQARHKILMLEAGAINLQIDEIGKHLQGAQESLDVFLEMYDTGMIKANLTKNTKENTRYEEIVGSTPTNMILFGAPCALLDGSKNEELFEDALETGFARRCLFGYAKHANKRKKQTAQERLDEVTSHVKDTFIEDLADNLETLADVAYLDRVLGIDKQVGLIFIEYQLMNEEKADDLGEHDELRRLELMHRHFKAMKLAGAFAFIDASPEVTEDHAYYAIKLAEESGAAFDSILTRDRPHVKLAKYLAETKNAVTQSDMVQDLPFYKGHTQAKQDMLNLAISYGYRNSILIKRSVIDGIEFMHGEPLKATNLEAIQTSYSTDLAKGYRLDTCKFMDLHKLTQAKGMHWCAHGFKEEHRCEDNVIPGFNILVLDVDHGVNMSTAKLLLKGYRALFYTTKSHQLLDERTGLPGEDRFRVVMPMNYELKLDAKDHKEFWNNIFEWLPFEVDHASAERSRKWMSNPGQHEYMDGEILDVLPFIPKTTKNEEFKARVLDQAGMDNLERWVINNAVDGTRNKILHRYAMILLDGGFAFDAINRAVCELNDKLPDKLSDAEILGTIMVSVSKAIAKR